MNLRVAFPYDRPVTEYEPTRIHLAPEYIFLENIYSPLIEISKNGTPVAGIAEKYEWKGSELHLTIRDNLTTIDGYKITTEDVVFSLKRLLILSENTHGNFKDLICPNDDLNSIKDNCPGIVVKDKNTIILKSKAEKAFLVEMLAAIDFAIIPKTSVDPKSLAINDYRNTTGPYYVESDDKKGNIILKANKNHYNYSDSIPQSIQLVPSGVGDNENSIELFKKDKVDYITTIDKLKPERIIALSKDTKSQLHQTMNIRTYVLTFTQTGLSKFNKEQRLSIGKSVRHAFGELYEDVSGYEKTDQFFPTLSDGSLTEAQSLTLKEIFDKTEEGKGLNLSMSIVRLGDTEEMKNTLLKWLPRADIHNGSNLPNFIDYQEGIAEPDCFISGPDTGFIEDIGLISYSMYAGFFGLDRKQGNKWLADYMNITDKEERLTKLKELHFSSLEEAIMIPLVSAPYVALARQGWNIELPSIYANNPFWTLFKDSSL